MTASVPKPLDAWTIEQIESGLSFPMPKKMIARHLGVTVAQVQSVGRKMRVDEQERRKRWMQKCAEWRAAQIVTADTGTVRTESGEADTM